MYKIYILYIYIYHQYTMYTAYFEYFWNVAASSPNPLHCAITLKNRISNECSDTLPDMASLFFDSDTSVAKLQFSAERPLVTIYCQKRSILGWKV